jgi:vancomycin resistance protein VanW
MIRQLIPPAIRLQLRLLQRRLSDRKQRMRLPLASSIGTLDEPIQLQINQVIKRSHLFENKVHNLHRASQCVGEIVIQPGEVFSFWKIIGNPSERNGYKKGRNIVNGKLQEAVGGGLCQLSGIIYHASLLAGLEIIERHNHTVDIYKEEDRFTPLGADATVVYGYKDLRIRNSLSSPIRYSFTFEETLIVCAIRTNLPLTPKELIFARSEEPFSRHIRTTDGQTGETIAISDYKLPAPLSNKNLS